ncbi:hypothetical protein P691DRAFT_735097 [Macrolepiota fuliginosa MF-IS2]|uniref:Uncharacterized protein n=1 Tax=Macrolepiota fuliginosa MF-IS2 TaxID=1400762 RepID=A0A9P5X8N4_9AGAR|nr:hypothetical protein P691DRAFT_735097 [Macrolepiota fuliginosa MF-IS2]
MDQVQGNPALVNIFIALQITGTLGFFLILLTAFLSPQVFRHPTWFSFCLSWIVWGVSFSLLFFAGQQTHVTSQSLCIAQSALVYAVPVLTGLTSVALVVYLLLNVLSALLSRTAAKPHFVMFLLVCIPWLLGGAAFMSFLLYAIKHPSDVQLNHNGTYCGIVNSYLPKITAVTSTCLAVTIVILEILIGIILYRHKSYIHGFPQSVSLATQLALFTTVALSAAGIGLVFVATRTRGAVFDIMMSAVLLAASVIFGSQRDILLTWMFWRPRSSALWPTQRTGWSSGELSSIESTGTVGRPQ